MKPAHTLQKPPARSPRAELPWGNIIVKPRAAVATPWPKLFGFHLLKMGMLSAELATDKCAISHQVNV